MKRAIGAVVLLVCIGLLSSCSLIPSPAVPLYDDSDQQSAEQMKHIAAAISDNDSAALKKLFSPRAQEKAADLDGGLKYFLSVFDSGKMTWKSAGTGSSSDTAGSKTTTELFCNFDVRADGNRYDLFFAYFPNNELLDPKNVGIYALGVSPYTKDKFTVSGEPKPFYKWKSSFDLMDHVTLGDPSVYVPKD